MRGEGIVGIFFPPAFVAAARRDPLETITVGFSWRTSRRSVRGADSTRRVDVTRRADLRWVDDGPSETASSLDDGHHAGLASGMKSGGHRIRER